MAFTIFPNDLDYCWPDGCYDTIEEAQKQIEDLKQPSYKAIEYKGWALQCSNCGIMIPPKIYWKDSTSKERTDLAYKHFDEHESRGCNTKFVKVIHIK